MRPITIIILLTFLTSCTPRDLALIKGTTSQEALIHYAINAKHWEEKFTAFRRLDPHNVLVQSFLKEFNKNKYKPQNSAPSRFGTINVHFAYERLLMRKPVFSSLFEVHVKQEKGENYWPTRGSRRITESIKIYDFNKSDVIAIVQYSTHELLNEHLVCLLSLDERIHISELNPDDFYSLALHGPNAMDRELRATYAEHVTKRETAYVEFAKNALLGEGIPITKDILGLDNDALMGKIILSTKTPSVLKRAVWSVDDNDTVRDILKENIDKDVRQIVKDTLRMKIHSGKKKITHIISIANDEGRDNASR